MATAGTHPPESLGPCKELWKQLGFNRREGRFDLRFSEVFYDSQVSAIEVSGAGQCLPSGL